MTFFSLPPLAKVVCLSCLPPHWSGLEWGGGRKRSCALLEVGGAGWGEKEGQEGRGILYVRTCPDPDFTRYSSCPRHAPSCRHCTLTRLSAQTILRTARHKCTYHLGGLHTMSTEMYYAYEDMHYGPPSSHHTTPHIQYAQLLIYIHIKIPGLPLLAIRPKPPCCFLITVTR